MSNPYPSDNPDFYTGANFSGVEFANVTYTGVSSQDLVNAYVGFTPSVTFQIIITTTDAWEVDTYWNTAPDGAFTTYGSQSYSGKGNCTIIDTVPTLASYWKVTVTDVSAGGTLDVTMYASSSQQGGRGAVWGVGSYQSIPGDVATHGTTYQSYFTTLTPGTYIVHYEAVNALVGRAQVCGINAVGTAVIYWSSVNPAAGSATNTITAVGYVQPRLQIINAGGSDHTFSFSMVRGY